MKITYTAPNRAHHYPYAEALHKAGHLHAFVSGFSRFSPRSPLPAIGDKLKRHDFYQNIFLASLRVNAPRFVKGFTNKLSNYRLDRVSYDWAKDSDVFLFYRTQGFYTTKRLHQSGSPVVCVMEEVNSHIDNCHRLMNEELHKIGLRDKKEVFADHRLRLKTYEQADYILCPSEFVRESFLQRGFAEEKILKVNFGFPRIKEQMIEEKPVNKESFRLLFVGQLNYRKGLRYAIEAFKKLQHPKKEFIIVGPKTPISGLENTSIPDGVIFKGVLKGKELENEYLKADAFILPSIEEGLALVQGEALSFGCPLLITSSTGGADLIRNGREGYIVAPSNSDQLAEALNKMAADRIRLAEMSAAALAAAKELGNWDKAAELLVSKLKQAKTTVTQKLIPA